MNDFFEETYGLKLSPQQRSALKLMIERDGATLDEIALHLYDFGENEPAGDVRASLRVLLSQARRELETVGWTIPRYRGGRADHGLPANARYNVERMK